MSSMTETQDRKRDVFMRLIGREVDEQFVPILEAADTYMDASLDVLENEEPSLLKWLDGNDEVDNLLKVNSMALYGVIEDALNGRRGLEHGVRRAQRVINRVVYAVAAQAALRERSVRLEGDEFFKVRDGRR